MTARPRLSGIVMPAPSRPPLSLVVTTPLSHAPSLLARVASGDERAVRECVETFGGMLWMLAQRWSTDAADAEDAVQEIFFELWKHAGRFDSAQASEHGFVAMIARRRLIDRARKRQREVITDEFPDGFDVVDEGPDHGEQVSEAMDARAALAQLTPLQRQFIERHLLDGRTHEEIARESSVPLGTVKSHIRRGLLKARALLTARASAAAADTDMEGVV
jgi:RNA polymerase sigma-70 factor, ECF subfamily